MGDLLMAKGLKYDCQIQFLRPVLVDDGFSTVPTFAPYGVAMWAARMDVSDAERLRAGEVGANLTRRFIVQSDEFIRGISVKDRLVFEGQAHEIFGIKDIGNHYRREFTAGARVDG